MTLSRRRGWLTQSLICGSGNRMATPPLDPVLTRFRSAVTRLYGERVERVVLYGSRARGDYRPDSDYDIALFLRDMPDRAEESGKSRSPSGSIPPASSNCRPPPAQKIAR